MKVLKFIFVFFLLLQVSIYSNGQTGSQLVTTLKPTNGLVSTGSYFQADVSFTYNSANSTQYRLIVELPENVDWPIVNSSSFTTDASTITIDYAGISNTGNTYYIPFTTLISGVKSTNFVINYLRNTNSGNCSSITSETILFKFEGKTGGTYSQIATSQNEVRTPILSNTAATLTLSLSQHQELDGDNVNRGNFPYYLDLSVTASGAPLTVLPTISLTYPSGQLEYINAVLYNEAAGVPPFHDQILTTEHVTDSTGLINIIPDYGVTLNSGGTFIRIYFRPLGNQAIAANAVSLSAVGARYKDCFQEEQEVVVNPLSLGSFQLASSPNLFPSFSHQNRELKICTQNCDFDIEQTSSVFFFEINNIYSQFGQTAPVVRLECPATVVKINSLTFTPEQFGLNTPVFKFIAWGGNNSVQNATVSGNTVTFGTSIPQTIFIEGYAQNNLNAAFDFRANYSVRIADVSAINSNLRRFSLNYENFSNTKIYYSAPVNIEYNCLPGLIFSDFYENITNQQFQSTVNYLGQPRPNIMLEIKPKSIQYNGIYKISDFVYKLNPNMTFDPSSSQILISENGLNNLRPLSRTGDLYTINNSRTTYYKNIQIQVDRANNELIIRNIDLNNTNDCGTAKTLNIIFRSIINPTASFKQGGYTSSTIDPKASFIEKNLANWNIIRDLIDKASTEVKVLCPGDGQELSDFEAGQIVTVQYVIVNENQNPLKNFVVSIPELSSAEFAGETENISIKVRSSQFSVLPQFYQPEFSSGGVKIRSLPEFQLNGYDRLLINVQYTLDNELPENFQINNITFELESFTSIDGVGRSKVNFPAEIKSVRIVERSVCIPRPPCSNCVTSFSPIPGKEYVVSAWLKEDYNDDSSPIPNSYKNSGIQISFNDGDLVTTGLFTPSGPIIDGWQRIEMTFVVPLEAYNINIELVNTGDNNVYFDDIRIHPMQSNMKSFVYDASTQRLVAELDENNYATLYEYDDEGILIRVKKETERGVMTIKETRNNQSKIR